MTRRALVTGGARGLGAACVERLRADGANVIAVDLAGSVDHIVDVCDAAAVLELSESVGHIDILVNSAGVVGPNSPFWEITETEWQTTFNVNVNGTFNTCRAFTPMMVDAGWGRIVNLASMAGKDGNPNLSAYSASKAAVIGFTKSIGKELATTGVLVNAVAPAVFATPMNDSTAPDVLERLVGLIPMKRLGRPEELAALVSWLASDSCSFSTGSVYDISGGRATY